MFGKIRQFFGKKTAAVTAAGGFGLVLAGSASASTPASAPDLSSVNLPFTIGGMLETATNFLGMYGQWVLLALGVIFSPVLYGLAVKLVKTAKSSFAKT